MDKNDTSITLDTLRLSRRLQKTDYKQKLEREAAQRDTPDDVLTAELPSPFIDRVQALAGHPEVTGAAFQCMAVAALQTLDRVCGRERQVAEAALSLAQRQKLDRMIEEVTATAEALRATLTRQGEKMLVRDAPPPRTPDARGYSWWFSLSDALHVLDQSAAWMRSVAAGQPRGGATHTLGRIITLLLSRHHRDLLTEAEQWMD